MTLLLFGIAREIVGAPALELRGHDASGAPPSTVAELHARLTARYPELGALGSLRYAVNQAFAAGDTAIGPADELALIPPVSGG